MTIHLTWTYLWVAIGIIWFAGIIVGRLMTEVGEWPWWSRLIIVFWPVGVPCCLVIVTLIRFGYWLTGTD